jgi:hypothetical protein
MTTTTIWRPCYATREEVMRALDSKQAAYNKDQIDRQITMASEDVDGLCQRQFYPEDATRFLDWPNYQYAYPWRIWLERNELAANQTQNPSMILASGGTAIPSNAFFCRSENYGPPFTRIELDRSKNFSFGNGPTPQRDISIQGTFGYWLKTWAAGTITSALTDTTSPIVNVSTSYSPGVGDAIVVDSERMIVQDKAMVDTGIAFDGLATVSAADNQVAVPDATKFATGEILRADSERLLVVDILTSTLLAVKRAWDGTILAPHTSGTLFAQRQLTVLRGALGTSGATHLNNAPVSVFLVPGLVKELAIAESTVGLTQEPAAYGGGTSAIKRVALRSAGSINEPAPGEGIPDLRDRVCTRYGRRVRSRVI